MNLPPDLHRTKLETRLATSFPATRWAEAGLVVAVSGGADSVALLGLLDVLARQGPEGPRLVVAHFDHGLRGEASRADARFVESLAGRLGWPFELGRAGDSEPVPAPTRSESSTPVEPAAGAPPARSEAACRKARYAFLTAAAHRRGCRYVATAHTADDQCETVLHHLLRGTGLKGLAGMGRARPLAPGLSLVRPLLEFRRGELRQYLEGLGQGFCTDSSNQDPRYTRNRIRQELVPAIERIYGPQALDSVLRLAKLARQVDQATETWLEPLIERCRLSAAPQSLTLDPGALDGMPQYLVCELLRWLWRSQGWPAGQMGRRQWDSLARLLGSPGARAEMFPGGVRVEHRGGRFYLERASRADTSHSESIATRAGRPCPPGAVVSRRPGPGADDDPASVVRPTT